MDDEAIVLLSADGVVLDCSRGTETLLGRPLHALIGEKVGSSDETGPLLPLTMDELGGAVRSGKTGVGTWFARPNGPELHLVGIAARLPSGERNVVLRVRDATAEMVGFDRLSALRHLARQLDEADTPENAACIGRQLLDEHARSPRSEPPRLPGVERPVMNLSPLQFAEAAVSMTNNAAGRLAQRDIEASIKLEVLHRLKNVISMAHSIVRVGLKDVDPSASATIFERFEALAAAQQVLSNGGGSGSIVAILDSAVTGPHGGDRIRCTGPEVVFGAQATIHLSLALQELATNAAKYGALSTQAGRLCITWNFLRDDGRHSLVIDWVESEGPPVVEPTRKGFGTRLIRAMLPGPDNLETSYDPSGLRVRMRFDISEILR